jgi:hypothetical protein
MSLLNNKRDSMLEDLDLYELTLEGDEDGVFANSFVESPAIERNFVAFNKQKEIKFESIDDEKRLVAGPLLVPHKKIIRYDEQLGMYNVFFKPETIEKIARKFMKNKFTNEVTVDHETKVNDVYLTESWIIEQSSKDKSNLYGFTLPKGTWFGIYKVDNDEVWKDVKEGKYLGFSIEGVFEHKATTEKFSQLFTKDIDELTDTESEVLLSYIKSIVKKKVQLESYNDYPQSATNNAKRALEWADKNGWGECGTPVGKARANQLANREPISRDTIGRMASFKRQQENKDTPYSEGCGGLMWDAWGGTSGVEWAINKLKEIDNG